MSNAILNQICNDENDPMLSLKICCNMKTYFQCKLHGQRTIQVEDFGLVHAIENVCNLFRWRNREDVEIRSKFVILKLAKRINELQIDDESHIKRSNKWVMKEKKKSKWCNNWNLIFVLIVVVFFLFLSITKNTANDGKFLCIIVATYDSYVATYAPYVVTYHPFVATCDSNVLQMTHVLLHMSQMLLQMRHMLLQMTYLLLQMNNMLLQMTNLLLQMNHILLQMNQMLLKMSQMVQHITQ
ncbi:hypothetical protein H5410_031640 [Solanum commersonii]|uniref:Transmembrane protein n=1 Tax=Solanum commersonii TaxID=4109 RepID=A0A9J5YMY3_SOLCO|nr:hypothetical protein H5410_031640 [Solanum commersonii]